MRVVGKQLWHFDKTISNHVEPFLIDSYVDATFCASRSGQE